MHRRSEFPSETVHILTAHSDEVWFLVFSHDGSRLASGAKDGEIILWDMKVCSLVCGWLHYSLLHSMNTPKGLKFHVMYKARVYETFKEYSDRLEL